ncbi:adenosylcobalamin-dependent ribonucleoside-diphosphate reductase [Polynucleobacter sp. IMCC30063]|uniref:adenosylcobalamin-dependent ribonucleoside-diphosphate reductase n=1 Tax=Polynucleobacter sp. IMCC30063 TaxID=2907298 RepID=UPI001F1F4D52|nr:adenosylcobalamin-dependent ribonucleoside-diphosphate reductase [Polynucleobacter sp. IMCC30063]MCE7506244.1 adenosylcobalamin-dependent ribonucleoside-diphosphate reductase [Polynucleobacter sp. IMCC30063]
MQQISIDVLKEKYLKPGEEDAEAIFKRVAMGLAAVELPALQKKIEALFLKNMLAGAIGAGRIMSAGGTGIQSTLINCFVQPVGDCIQDFDEDGFPGIYEALKQAAETMRRGGGVGYDFSRIRPKGAEVKGTASFASGPCSYINVFDQSCSTVESAGSRRGAQMGVLKIDHPDIFEFINAKRTPGRWNNFNVSVGVSDEFMRAVERDSLWDLVHKAKPSDKNITKEFHQRADGLWVYQTIKAKEIWHLVMESAYDFAEPGILFLDNINSDNNLSYCESIEATNPCGEQPLPPYGCCDLGPIILPRFVINPFGFAGTASFDYPGFIEAVKIQVRMLDNVLDVTYWPLKEQAIEAQSKRRIGVGFTGLGDALIMLKLAYNSNTGRSEAANIAKHLRDAAYQASVDLAKEKGAFPALDIEQYLSGTNFANRLDSNLKTEIRKFGIRNSHLLSIAPTGTVSLAFADNASNGIEPPFSWAYQRKKREADGSTREYSVEDHAWRVFKEMGGDINALPDYFITALTMSAEDHIAMMEVVQPYIDTAISKTVNVPADYPFASFVNLYLKAWQSNLKGLATYRPNSILGSVLHVNETEPEEIPITTQGVSNLGGNPSKKVVDRRPNGELPAVAEKINYWTQDGQKTLYLIISFLNVHGFVNGEEVQSERAIEFFMPVGQSGESQQWITSSMRLLSLAARGGFLVRALGDMRKVAWDRGPVRLGTRKKDDGIEVPMWHDSEVSAVAFAIENILIRRGVAQFNAHTDIQISNETAELNTSGMMRGKKCPECGAHALIKKDGCEYCTNCGFIGACG